MSSDNTNLIAAKVVKNNEFFTQLLDIKKEIEYYRDFLRGKIVYCNCDDVYKSNFSLYFIDNFETLGLKKLIVSSYNPDGYGKFLVYDGDKVKVSDLRGNGDFRSQECINLLDESDVVITNPPFSLFRPYITKLIKHKKKFLIIGSINAITFKEVFPYIMKNEIWLGVTKIYNFIQPDGTIKILGNICWFTNIDHNKNHEPIELTKKYSSDKYPKFENYNAINVDRVVDIPIDYDGIIGVPISFMEKYCPDQFEIVGQLNGHSFMDENGWQGSEPNMLQIGDKKVYKRILIKRK